MILYLKNEEEQNEGDAQENVLPLLQWNFLYFVETAIVEPLICLRLPQINVHYF
jgi:hypothetical protein